MLWVPKGIWEAPSFLQKRLNGSKGREGKKECSTAFVQPPFKTFGLFNNFCSLLLTHWTLVIGRAFVNIFPQRMGREGGQGAYPL